MILERKCKTIKPHYFHNPLHFCRAIKRHLQCWVYHGGASFWFTSRVWNLRSINWLQSPTFFSNCPCFHDNRVCSEMKAPVRPSCWRPRCASSLQLCVLESNRRDMKYRYKLSAIGLEVKLHVTSSEGTW